MEKRRRLPVGIQSFETVRRDGYVYVDKTDLVWELANGDAYNYLSRPRRFGKSLLLDTLRCYFEGRKNLFDGLRIMQLETEWAPRAVIRLDMSSAGCTGADIQSYLSRIFTRYEKQYGIDVQPGYALQDRFATILETACDVTQHRVVVLIDEYDSPLQQSWHTPFHEECTTLYRKIFSILKSEGEYLRFVFITGITKFTQISLFSVLNNLRNITFMPDSATICGITHEELLRDFQPELASMAAKNGWTAEETVEQLRKHYDGYHFSRLNMTGVYNPFCLVSALGSGIVENYWAASGATTLLLKFISNFAMKMKDFECCPVPRRLLETSDISDERSAVFLFLAGYLTIQGYEAGNYILGFPNREVRETLATLVLPALSMKDQDLVTSTQAWLHIHLTKGEVAEAMKCIARKEIDSQRVDSNEQ